MDGLLDTTYYIIKIRGDCMKKFLFVSNIIILIIDIVLFFALVYLAITQGITVTTMIAVLLNIGVIVVTARDIKKGREGKL